MAGSAKSVNTDIPIDSHFLSYINNLSSGGNTTNVTSSKDTIKQYVKTKNGIFNGAFGSVAQTLTISSGVLDLTKNSTGAVVVRRTVYVQPESSTTDTLDSIELNGLELPNQELILMSSTGNTITIAHNASASGTRKNIYCPGDTSYALAPHEAVVLIYDAVNTIWIVTGSSSSSATVADNSITFAKIQDIATMKVIGRTASGSGDSSEISILDEDTMSSNSATALATQQSIKAYVLANSGSTSFSGFTADATLDMGDRNIEDVNVLKINSGSANSANAFTIYGTSTQGVINLVDDNDTFIIAVDGTSKFSVGDGGIYASTHLSMQGNTIYLDSDVDTTIHSNTDDSIQIATGGSVRMSIGNTSTIIANALTVLGSTTLGDNGSDLINIPGLVNFTGNYSAVAQTAGNSTGYISILIGGVAKKLYYY